MKRSWIFVAGGLVVLVLIIARASQSETAEVPSPAESASSTSTTAPATPPLKLETLYDRSMYGRVVHVQKQHQQLHSIQAQTKSGRAVTITLSAPIAKLDSDKALAATELLAGLAFEGDCAISLSMYVDAGADAKACADALDPSNDLHGRKQVLDLKKLNADDPSLYADTIDFDTDGVSMKILRVVGTVEDLCIAMHAHMKSEADRKRSLTSSLINSMSIKRAN